MGSALAEKLARPPEPVSFPDEADMGLFTSRGIHCIMVGTDGIELVHVVNERISIESVYKLARVLVRSLVRM